NLNNIYIAGSTGSEQNMISSNAFDSEFINNRGAYANEAFIAKFDPNGNRIWGTYYGGDGEDVISSIEVGNDSNLYVMGYTDSENNIASVGAYKQNLTPHQPMDRRDSFVAKFDPNGN